MNKMSWSTFASATQYVEALIAKVPLPFFKSNRLFRFLVLKPSVCMMGGIKEERYECGVSVAGLYHGTYARIVLLQCVTSDNFMNFVESSFDIGLSGRLDIIEMLTLECRLIENNSNPTMLRHAEHCVKVLKQFPLEIFSPSNRGKFIEMRVNIKSIAASNDGKSVQVMKIRDPEDMAKIKGLEKELAEAKDALAILQLQLAERDSRHQQQHIENTEPPLKRPREEMDGLGMSPYVEQDPQEEFFTNFYNSELSFE